MSEATELSEKKRRKIIHYNTALESLKVELKDFEGNKKDKILELAKILEETGHPKESISEKVGDDLSGYLSRRYVREVLGNEYKDPKQVRNQAQTVTSNISERGTTSAIVTNESNEEKQPLLVTNNGETEEVVDQRAESALDEIYGGKSFSQMEKEARREVEEDKEETLENPNNGPRVINSSNNNIPLLSDIPPEIREKLARFDEMEQALQEQKAIADQKGKDFFNLKRAYTQLRSGSKDEELTQLKNNLSNLQSELAEIDKESLEREFKFKEIEVLKIHPDTVRLLTDVSRKSQRTLFLIVHPKTMMIKGVKTDVQMHMTQARRNAGLEA